MDSSRSKRKTDVNQDPEKLKVIKHIEDIKKQLVKLKEKVIMPHYGEANLTIIREIEDLSEKIEPIEEIVCESGKKYRHVKDMEFLGYFHRLPRFLDKLRKNPNQDLRMSLKQICDFMSARLNLKEKTLLTYYKKDGFVPASATPPATKTVAKVATPAATKSKAPVKKAQAKKARTRADTSDRIDQAAYPRCITQKTDNTF